MDQMSFSFHLETQHREYKPRNILTLEERVQVIREYERNPVYQRIAEKYNCSSKQIKNIIANKDSVLLYYANFNSDDSTNEAQRRRHQKIQFLNKVIYEYILRAVYHNIPLNENMVRVKALAVKEAIAIENFYPYNIWMQNFKKAYKLTDFELGSLRKRIVLREPKKSSLNCIDIIQYVSQRERKEKRLQSLATATAEDANDNQMYQAEVSRVQENINNNNENNGNNEGEPTVTYEDGNDNYMEFEIEDDSNQNSRTSNVVSLDFDDENNSENYGNGDDINGNDVDNDADAETQSSSGGNVNTNTPSEHDKLPDASNPQEALRYLKALEDYALLTYNFRAIGLITQLELTLQNPPESSDFND